MEVLAVSLSQLRRMVTIRAAIASTTAPSEVGAFYWTVLAPDIVNSGREEQGSVSV